ncbi:MAG: hypothetical protein U0132_24165 [Gemmatimonadaceae bacterium]
MTRLDDFDYEIRPFLGVGMIRFGQPRDDVVRLLGTPSRTFRKVPFATSDTDAFDAAGLHVYYDRGYLVESIDAVAPSAISFDGISFLGRAVEDVVRAMAERGYKDDSLTFNEVGISLYDEGGIVKCVTAFPRGYFDLSNPDSPVSRAKAAAAAWRRQSSEFKRLSH